MLTPRNVVLVAAAAGALAGVPLSKGQACDNDRFPCPVIEEVPTQDSVDAAPAEPAPESKKKPKQAGQNSAMSKGERKTAPAPARPKPNQANRAPKPGELAAHEQANSAGSPPPTPAAQVASPVPVLPEQFRDASTVRIESAPVPTASAKAEGAGGMPSTPTFDTQQLAAAGDFRLAERNEVAVPASTSTGWSWLYLLVLLGGALAAVTTVRWFRPNTRGASPFLARLYDRLGRISASR
jgi:hypothetical protein